MTLPHPVFPSLPGLHVFVDGLFVPSHGPEGAQDSLYWGFVVLRDGHELVRKTRVALATSEDAVVRAATHADSWIATHVASEPVTIHHPVAWHDDQTQYLVMDRCGTIVSVVVPHLAEIQTVAAGV